MSERTTCAEAMAGFAAGLRYEDLGETAVCAAKRCIADALGCAIAARGGRAATRLRATVARRSSSREATLLGGGGRADVEGAALVGCTMVRDLDANDLYAGPPDRDTGHFSDALPAVLAQAEASGSDGRELLTAVVAVYELQAALAEAYLWMERGLHSVSQVGWALPAVLGRLRGLSEEQIVNAISTSGTMSGLVLQSWLGAADIPDIKAVSTGMVAAGAVRATDLAAEGLSAPAGALETLFERLPSDARPELFQRLAERSPAAIQRTMFKRFPAQIYVQAAIEAAIGVRRRLQLEGLANVASVRLEGHSRVAAGVQGSADAFHPATRGSADHSTPFAVAVALRDGGLTPASYRDEPWADPDLAALMERTTLVVDSDLDRALSERGQLGCRLTVRTAADDEATESVTQQRGHPDRPLSDADLREKARAFVDPVLGDGAADRLWDAVHRLEEQSSLDALLAACAVGERDASTA
jgi:2-methylcitrate dehydratase